MDDRYEFENAEYRIAAIQIKAIAYDIVMEISKRKQDLASKSKEEIANLLKELNEKNDNLLALTSKLEETLEALDNLDKKSKMIDLNQSISSPLPPKKEEQNVQNTVGIKPIEEKQSIIIPEEEKEEEYDTEIESEQSVPVETPKEEIQKEPEKAVISQPVSPITSEISVPLESNNVSTKKQFQKTTKNMSKAIMVKPNQLANLRKSRVNQEQILIAKGIFSPSSINQTVTIESKEPIKQALPDDVERQIEDLTVKANIYYNEGEITKAQELYDQIKRLTNQN